MFSDGGRLLALELLALPPRRSDHLRQVLADDRSHRVVRAVVRVRARVDGDPRLRRERDHVLDVERGLALTGPRGVAAVDGDIRDQRVDRLAVDRVALLERPDVVRVVGLELEDRDGLASALVGRAVRTPGLVQPRQPVGRGDLVGGETALGRRRRGGAGANRLGSAGGDVGPVRGRQRCRVVRLHQQWPFLRHRAQPEHALHVGGDRRIERRRLTVDDRARTVGQRDPRERCGECRRQ